MGRSITFPDAGPTVLLTPRANRIILLLHLRKEGIHAK